MLEILGIKNEIDNIEKKLKESGNLNISASVFLLATRRAIIETELGISVLKKCLKESYGIEQINTEKSNKIKSKTYKKHAIDDFTGENYILPCGYYLDKIIQNYKTVICWVKNNENFETIKTVAICQNDDIFDLHKGVEVCMYKTLKIIAENNLKRY